jgi:hexosaminidase
MHPRSGRRVPAVVVAVLMAALSSLAATAGPARAAAPARPLTIPALQSWTPASGEFHIGAPARVLAPPELATEAGVLAADLRGLGYDVTATAAGATAAPGDIALVLDAGDALHGRESYRMTVGDVVVITGATSDGVFAGTRTVLQLLHQGPTIAAGDALDWPRYPERGLMLDDGDKYFSAAWIAAEIRELAYLKMNVLHLHFSDNGGFRVESESHPEIVARDHLTKQELRDLLALAARYHVMVVPEIDMPGHMTGVLQTHPELQLTNVAGMKTSSALDITNPASEALVHDLLDEYLPFFPGPYWCIGGDEYLPDVEHVLFPQLQTFAQHRYGADATSKDALLGFANWTASIVQAHGKTARMWSDDTRGGHAVTLDPRIILEWWTDTNPLSDLTPLPPQALLDQGHTIANGSWFPNYYNAGPVGALLPRPDMRQAYETWEPHEFSGAFFSPAIEGQNVHLPPKLVSPDEPRNLGSKIFVWTASDEPADTIAAAIGPRLRMLAQKTWGSPRLTEAYADFLPISATVGGPPAPAADDTVEPAAAGDATTFPARTNRVSPAPSPAGGTSDAAAAAPAAPALAPAVTRSSVDDDAPDSVAGAALALVVLVGAATATAARRRFSRQ